MYDFLPLFSNRNQKQIAQSDSFFCIYRMIKSKRLEHYSILVLVELRPTMIPLRHLILVTDREQGMEQKRP